MKTNVKTKKGNQVGDSTCFPSKTVGAKLAACDWDLHPIARVRSPVPPL